MPQNKKYKYTERAIAALRPSCASYVERKSYVTLRRPTSTSLTKSHTHVFNELIRWTKKQTKINGANTEPSLQSKFLHQWKELKGQTHGNPAYLSLNQIFKEVILDISGNDYFNQPSKGQLGCL